MRGRDEFAQPITYRAYTKRTPTSANVSISSEELSFNKCGSPNLNQWLAGGWCLDAPSLPCLSQNEDLSRDLPDTPQREECCTSIMRVPYRAAILQSQALSI